MRYAVLGDLGLSIVASGVRCDMGNGVRGMVASVLAIEIMGLKRLDELVGVNLQESVYADLLQLSFEAYMLCETGHDGVVLIDVAL